MANNSGTDDDDGVLEGNEKEIASESGWVNEESNNNGKKATIWVMMMI